MEHTCGRGGHDFSWRQVFDYLKVVGEPPSGRFRRLNAAPSSRRGDGVDWTELPAVVGGDDGQREFVRMVWPLVPGWMKDKLPLRARRHLWRDRGEKTDVQNGLEQRPALPGAVFLICPPSAPDRQIGVIA